MASKQFAILLFALCSSTMLVINKVTVHLFPAPCFVLIVQLATTALAVLLFRWLRLVEFARFDSKKAQAFAPVALAFSAAIFTNMKTLQNANVETFIVFRSSTPLVISFCDYLFLERELPSGRSFACLLLVLLGAAVYVATDKEFEVRAYAWVMSWLVIFVFDQIYIKFICDTIPMSTWERVFYTNSLSVLPVGVLSLMREVPVVTDAASWNAPAVFALIAASVCGIGMSYSSFLLRDLVSATSFTVIGVVCKLGSVLINCLIWDKHASPTGLAGLLLCLLAGSAYKQSPLRKKELKVKDNAPALSPRVPRSP